MLLLELWIPLLCVGIGKVYSASLLYSVSGAETRAHSQGQCVEQGEMLRAVLWGRNIPKGCPITGFQLLVFEAREESHRFHHHGRQGKQGNTDWWVVVWKRRGKLELISRLGHTEKTGPVSVSFTPLFYRTSYFLVWISSIPLTAPLFPDACNRCLAHTTDCHGPLLCHVFIYF